MRDELLRYYERELAFLRRSAGGFAQKYPEVAGRLVLDSTRSDDPHVERLIESVAMLAARVQMRIDDDFAEVSDALLGVLYPHYLAPVPSTTIVQFGMDPQAGAAEEGIRVPRHSLLYAPPVDGVRCRFRTAYDLELWPLAVESAELVSLTALAASVPVDARSALRLRLRVQGGLKLSDLSLSRLRLFLDADPGRVHRLYELFLRNPAGLALQSAPGKPAAFIAPDRIRPVGFARDEGLLEYPEESFLGYRHIQEYFAFPEKFATPVFSETEQAEGVTATDLPGFLAATVTQAMLAEGFAATEEQTRPLNICTRKLWEQLVVIQNTAAGQ